MQSAFALVDRGYAHPSFRLRRRELGFEVLLRLLGRAGYERLRFRRRHGRWPDIEAPVRFNEKVSVRKLREAIPNAPTLVDKVAVRNHVASRVGAKYLKEMYVATPDPAEIDFDALPDAFVAKANHGARMNIFVTRKDATDLESVRELLSAFLRRRIGRLRNEWWYDEVPPQALIEPYSHIAFDYRFWVYHGRVQMVKVADKSTGGMTYFDRDWRPQAFGVHAPGCDIPRPPKFDEMIEVADTLGADLPFVRVDLNSLDDGAIVFGELTLAPGSGWEHRTEEEDRVLGSFW